MRVKLLSGTTDQANEKWNHFKPNKVLQRCAEKFEMVSCKEASTPILKSCYLDADENGTAVD